MRGSKRRNRRKVRLRRVLVIAVIMIAILISIVNGGGSRPEEIVGVVQDEVKVGQEEVEYKYDETEEEIEEKSPKTPVAEAQNNRVETNNTNANVQQVNRPATSTNNTSNISTSDDWRIRLVNRDNRLPDGFVPPLANIDNYRRFDSRAIGQLNAMLSSMRREGVTNVWVQSAYRSIAEQRTLFNNRVNRYLGQGHSRSEAERLTSKWIMPPGASEHNLGLAVDFNNVNSLFEHTEAFAWLTRNAENYGFILRYARGTSHITGINYEPWHWRYVGRDHARRINQLGITLEEYIDYLEGR